jgi:hypothetical protein
MTLNASLLSATPFNKDYLDLASQLRLFVPGDKDLGVSPETYIRQIGEIEFQRRHQCGLRTLAAFEKSPVPDDWRELMRLYMVRRTRSFIKDNYAETDAANGRRFLRFTDGTLSYFPDRLPKRVSFQVDESDPNDLYAKLYSPATVDLINHLELPRYGLGNYITPVPTFPPTPAEAEILVNLSKAGKRLMGFCRTNLFKRLESSGYSFLLSIERHILRNFITQYALENSLPVPIGTQVSDVLDTRYDDAGEDELFDSDDHETTGGQIARHLKSAVAALPATVKIVRARADSGFYCWEAVEAYENLGCQFILVARKTARLVEHLKAAAWTPSPRTDADGQCEFWYQPEGWGQGLPVPGAAL